MENNRKALGIIYSQQLFEKEKNSKKPIIEISRNKLLPYTLIPCLQSSKYHLIH